MMLDERSKLRRVKNMPVTDPSKAREKVSKNRETGSG
jgi:hypothetical protein